MNVQGPLRWIEGKGWLVFSGGASSEIRSQVLTRAEADGAVAYVSLSEDRGDALMEDMDDLGAPTGYLVDLTQDRGEGLKRHIEEASVIVIEVGSSLEPLLQTLDDDTKAVLRGAYEQGSVILIEGLAINAFGRWVVDDDGGIVEGLNWLEDVFLEPSVTSAEESRAVQDIMQVYAQAIAIEIAEESAIAFGGDGRVELWGEQQVTISLGRQYQL